MKSEGTTSESKLGSSLAITDDGSIFVGAPGFNTNEGVIHQFVQNEEGNYSIDMNITSPVLGSFFGVHPYFMTTTLPTYSWGAQC